MFKLRLGEDKDYCIIQEEAQSEQGTFQELKELKGCCKTELKRTENVNR